MPEAYIVDAVRTPIGRRKGSFAEVHAGDLGAHSIKALVERTGIDPSIVDDVIFGCVDSVFARHLLNKIASTYCVPYIDMGVGIKADIAGDLLIAYVSCQFSLDFFYHGSEGGPQFRSVAIATLQAQNIFSCSKADDRGLAHG